MTRRLFGTLCGFVFLVNFGRVTFAPLLETLGAAFDAGPAALGVVTSLVWVGSAAPRIPVGYLLTRVPRRYVVLATGLTLAGAAALTASSGSLLALQAGAFAIGLSSGAYFVAAVPLVGELYPESTGRAIGVHGTASQLAAVVAPTVVVTLLTVLDWRAVFWALAAGSLVLTAGMLVVLRTRDEPVPGPEGGDRDFLGALKHWRTIASGVVLIATLGFVWMGLFNFYISYLTTVKGVSSTLAGNLLTVAFGAGVPAFWFSGRLADRFSHVPYILGINVGFAVVVASLTYVSSTAGLVALSALLGYVAHSVFPAVDTYMLETLPRSNRASAYAVFSGVALFVEANGSGVLGYLTASGVPFDTAFRAGALGICLVTAAVAGLWRSGRFPTPA